MRGPLARMGVCLVALGIGLLGPARDATAQDTIKLKPSHFLPAAHNHHANVILPWVEEVSIFRGIMPFLATMIVRMVLLTAWPEMALVLPRTMK